MQTVLWAASLTGWMRVAYNFSLAVPLRLSTCNQWGSSSKGAQEKHGCQCTRCNRVAGSRQAAIGWCRSRLLRCTRLPSGHVSSTFKLGLHLQIDSVQTHQAQREATHEPPHQYEAHDHNYIHYQSASSVMLSRLRKEQASMGHAMLDCPAVGKTCPSSGASQG